MENDRSANYRAVEEIILDELELLETIGMLTGLDDDKLHSRF